MRVSRISSAIAGCIAFIATFLFPSIANADGPFANVCNNYVHFNTSVAPNNSASGIIYYASSPYFLSETFAQSPGGNPYFSDWSTYYGTSIEVGARNDGPYTYTAAGNMNATTVC